MEVPGIADLHKDLIVGRGCRYSDARVIGVSCQKNGQPYRDYYFATTELDRPAGSQGGTSHNRAAVEDDIARQRRDSTLGLEDVVDSANGEKLKIESGANYYWMDIHGNILDTDSYKALSVDSHERLRRP